MIQVQVTSTSVPTFIPSEMGAATSICNTPKVSNDKRDEPLTATCLQEPWTRQDKPQRWGGGVHKSTDMIYSSLTTLLSCQEIMRLYITGATAKHAASLL